MLPIRCNRLLIQILFRILVPLFSLSGLEQTFRTGWSYQDESSCFYRINDGICRSEILTIRDNADGSTIPKRFILEAPYCVLGNIRPEGLFRFFEMNTLLSRDALLSRTLYRADSSAASLNSPGGAFYLPGKGGVLFETKDEEALNGGAWYALDPLPYTVLDLALDFCTKGEEESDESWFPEKSLRPAGSLWHGGMEGRYEGCFWSGRLKGALSGGSHFLPGCSLLPELSLYLDRFQINLRFWRNSTSYRSRYGDYPHWNWQSGGNMLYQADRSLWDASLQIGRTRPERDIPGEICREFGLKGQGERGRTGWKLSGEYSLDPQEVLPHCFRPEGALSYRGGCWKAGTGGSCSWDGPPFQQSSREVYLEGRYNFPYRLRCNLITNYRADVYSSSIKPCLAAEFPTGKWLLKGTVSYSFTVYGASEDQPFAFSLKAEWSS